jgi:hypothetical protein
LKLDFADYGLTQGQHTVTWTLEASDGTAVTPASNGEGSFTLNYVTGIDEVAAAGGFMLGQSYPNPVGDGALAVVPFTTDRAAAIVITLHDALGREVSTLADGDFAPGEHRVEFPACATGARDLPVPAHKRRRCPHALAANYPVTGTVSLRKKPSRIIGAVFFLLAQGCRCTAFHRYPARQTPNSEL